MVDVGGEELLLLSLWEEGETDRPRDGTGAVLSRIVEKQGARGGRLSKQIELARELEGLRAQGLVETETRDGETWFVLTERGASRASEIHDWLSEERIRVVDGGADRLSMGAAATELGTSVAEIASDVSAEGVYYAEPTSSDDLVDRDALLDRFRDALRSADREGSGGGLFLTGPAGVGKTALAEHMVRTAREDGFDVVTSRARTDADPYGPIREVIAGIDGTPSPFDTDWPSVEEPEAYRTQQTALFSDLTDSLLPGDDDPTRVVFVDELHRADPATESYLHHLLERVEGLRVVFVGCYRPRQLPEDSRIAPGAVPDGAPVEYARVSPFDRDGTGGIVANVVGHRDPPEEFVDAVQEWTGGNPLFVEEVTRTLLETDQLAPDFEWYPADSAEIDAPNAVTGTIRERIAALDEPAKRLLLWAALVGERVPVDVLEAVCSFDPHGFRTLLAFLVDAGVFDWADDGESVTFRSALLREALLEEFGADDRRERHRAIARAFERTTGGSDDRDDWKWSVDVARHRRKAGDDEAAVEWYRSASERARSLYAYGSAIRYLRDALEIAKRIGEETTLDISEQLAETYLVLGDLDEAERYVSFVRERATSVRRRQRMAYFDGRIANVRGDHAGAVERALEGFEMSETPTREGCQLLDLKAMAERQQGDREAAVETAREQRELATEVGEWDLVARAWRHLGVVAWRQSDYDRARECHLEAIELLETHDVADLQLEALIHNNLGVFARYRSNYDEALDCFEEALTRFDEIGDRRHMALARSNVAKTHWHRGEYDVAEELTRESLETFRRIGDSYWEGVCGIGLAQVQLRQGDYAAAEANLRAILEEGDALDDRRMEGRMRTVYGRLELYRDDHEAARDRLETALEIFEEISSPHDRARTARSLGRVATLLGEYDLAERHLRRSIEDCRDLDDQHGVAKARLRLGALALERDADDAEQHLETALESMRAVGDRHGEADAQLELGRLAARRGTPEVARDRLRDALEGFERVGDPHGAARALRALVTVCEEDGDDGAATEWCDRALELLAPDGELAHRREWFHRRRGSGEPGSGTRGRNDAAGRSME